MGHPPKVVYFESPQSLRIAERSLWSVNSSISAILKGSYAFDRIVQCVCCTPNRITHP